MINKVQTITHNSLPVVTMWNSKRHSQLSTVRTTVRRTASADSTWTGLREYSAHCAQCSLNTACDTAVWRNLRGAAPTVNYSDVLVRWQKHWPSNWRPQHIWGVDKVCEYIRKQKEREIQKLAIRTLQTLGHLPCICLSRCGTKMVQGLWSYGLFSNSEGKAPGLNMVHS
jgi:hypothetical protein